MIATALAKVPKAMKTVNTDMILSDLLILSDFFFAWGWPHGFSIGSGSLGGSMGGGAGWAVSFLPADASTCSSMRSPICVQFRHLQ
jgi:hypothetical protein